MRTNTGYHIPEAGATQENEKQPRKKTGNRLM